MEEREERSDLGEEESLLDGTRMLLALQNSVHVGIGVEGV